MSWLGDTYTLDLAKTIIDVGSVGQPGDDDRTVRKIYDNTELENFLGDRLREGR